jgi:hypothetical protein
MAENKLWLVIKQDTVLQNTGYIVRATSEDEAEHSVVRVRPHESDGRRYTVGEIARCWGFSQMGQASASSKLAAAISRTSLMSGHMRGCRPADQR